MFVITENIMKRPVLYLVATLWNALYCTWWQLYFVRLQYDSWFTSQFWRL